VPKLLQIFRALFDIHALLLAQFSFFVNYSLVSFVFPLSKVQCLEILKVYARVEGVDVAAAHQQYGAVDSL
ncbi:MAG: hypothetical protein WAU31_04625, partial [Candidatus Moraniibacteriota bacterium]